MNQYIYFLECFLEVMNMRRKSLFLLCSAVLTAGLSWGATIDLSGALQSALANRPLVGAAREQALAAEHAAGVAHSYYLPKVTVSESFALTDEPGNSMFMKLNQERLSLGGADLNHPPATRDFETRLSLQQPLYNPDISFGYRQALKGAEAAAASTRWSEEQLAFEAFSAYLGVQQAHAALAWAESSSTDAEEVLRVASQRREAGIALKADELRAKVLVADAKRRLVTVNNDLAIAKERLALALGKPEVDFDIAAPLTPDQLPLPEPTETLQRADLQVLDRQSQAAELAYRQSRAAYLPRAGMQASYALHDSATPFGGDGNGWSVGANLTWEIFDGFRRSEGKARAEALKRAAHYQRLDAGRAARFQVDSARRRAEEARLNFATARESLLAAEEGNRLTLERYQAGLANLYDLLGTQSVLDQGRMSVVQAETGLLLALGNIQFQNGTFLKNFVPKEVKP